MVITSGKLVFLNMIGPGDISEGELEVLAGVARISAAVIVSRLILLFYFIRR